MKMTVVTDASGNVVGTYTHPENPGKDDPAITISGGPGHITHDLDVPAEYEKIRSVEELHRRVTEQLKSR